ncbi:MAG: OmpH family outer membrane protein [Deltaproteobacteria bacterium]
MIYRISFLIGLFLAFSIGLSAQKFGYLNSNELMSLHPYVKGADSILVIYQNQLMSEGQKLVDSFQKNYEEYVKEANAGNLSKIQMQERENQLAQEQNKLRDYETEMQQKVIKKREELYKPILDNIQTAINAVGKEYNYTFIFDSGTGGLLFANDADNVIQLVKTKLGF